MEDKIKRLREPFDGSDIEWRIGNTNQKSIARQTNNPQAKPTKGQLLAYVTNRAIMNRLDDVVGVENWKQTFREHHKGTICALSIRFTENGEWITKEDGADLTNIEPTKGGLSDSMKRAAVQFGIGRHLYDAETVWVDLNEYGQPISKPSSVKYKTGKLNTAEANPEPSSPVPLDGIMRIIGSVTSVEELNKVYRALSPQMQKDEEIIAKCKEVKEGLQEIIG